MLNGNPKGLDFFFFEEPVLYKKWSVLNKGRVRKSSSWQKKT